MRCHGEEPPLPPPHTGQYDNIPPYNMRPYPPQQGKREHSDKPHHGVRGSSDGAVPFSRIPAPTAYVSRRNSSYQGKGDKPERRVQSGYVSAVDKTKRYSYSSPRRDHYLEGPPSSADPLPPMFLRSDTFSKDKR